MTFRILISGSTGFVGKNLIKAFQNKDVDIYHLIRRRNGEKAVFYDPIQKLIDQEKIRDFDAVIHLAGESVAGFWTKSKKEKIYRSRVESTRFLVETFKRLNCTPKVFISASAIGFYGSRKDEDLTESSGAGDGFLAKVCEDWEGEANKMPCRVVNLRFGHILGKTGGLLPKMKLAYKMGFAGKLGNGKQYISWIAIDDLTRIVEFILKNEAISGPVNVVSLNPVMQKEYGKILAAHLKRPFWFHLPKWLLKILFQNQADDMFLASQKVIPKKLEQNNFQFEYESIEDAFKKYI